MIFVTVGTELPFDRLVRAVDDWARRSGRPDVFAQIGQTNYRPSSIRFERFLEAPAYQRAFEQASVVVAHAGMGTILTARSAGKPILVMPRRAALGEHRNEHQLATARHLAELQQVEVAMDEAELVTRLDQLASLPPRPAIPPHASPELIETIRSFLAGAARPAARAEQPARLAPRRPATAHPGAPR